MPYTIGYKARQGDTVHDIARAAGVKSSEILSLNEDLKTNLQMVAGRTYRLPADAASNSASSTDDLIIEFRARKVEASKAAPS